jgi:DNA-binding NtrC family response regulator
MGQGKTTVLLVEDEPILAVLMTDVLTAKGFEIVVFPEASSALHYLFSGARVDVLFTDIELGAGMNGATLAQIVHEIWPDLPIVYASGRARLDQFAIVPGATFLPKPYSFTDVSARLAELTATQPFRHARGTAQASGYGSPR